MKWQDLFYGSLMIGIGAFLMTGCSSGPELSQGRVFKLRETSCRDLPGWEQDNFSEALPALLKSCQKPSEQWADFCEDLQDYRYATSSQIKAFLEQRLTPYIVVSYGKPNGTFTGYYEAELTGTRERVHDGQVPIYGLPDGYENGEKYDSREDIEEDGIDAPIIAWADDPVELFILHVQGSGRMITPDGEIKLGYAGNNGRTFVGLWTLLREYGVTGLHSMPQMKAWLQAHPKEAREIMQGNPRYIFFKENYGDSPYGSAGAVLTPKRSIAVDRQYIPMHTPMWLDTKDPNGIPLQRLVVAQDVGNAIKGPVRADFFWGHGEEAFNNAGRMKSNGRYFILLPK